MKTEFNVDKIKKLWLLDLIIKTGSFKGAATQAKITPSAVSQSLTSLERNIGRPLLIRKRGTITPTQDALAILEVVRPAFDAFDRLQEMGSQPVPKLTWLNFGTYESLAIDVLPGLVHRLREKLPRLRLGLRVSRTENLLTMIRKGELCSALITEADDLDRFYTKEVAVDQLGFFVSANHPIAEAGWRAVETYGVGSLASSKNGLPRYFSKFLKQLGPIKPMIYSDSFESLRSAAASGTIVAVLPRRVARRTSGLLEIQSPNAGKNTGEHRILVVSQLNCDQDEANFLAIEIRSLLDATGEFAGRS